MRILRIICLLVIAAFVVLASTVNPTLLWFVVAGVFIGAAYWYPRQFAWLALFGLAAGITDYLLLPQVSPRSPLVVPTVEVRTQIDAQYDTHRNGWVVNQEFMIPSASMEILSETAEHNARLDYSEASEPLGQLRIQDELQRQGWRLVRKQNNDPVFGRTEERFEPANVPSFPLRSPFGIEIEEPSVENSYLVASERSVVNLTAPMGLIASTEPPSDPKRVPGGEQRRVEVSASTSFIKIEAASPLARFEPIPSILDASGSSVTGYVVAALVGLFLGSLKDRVKNRIDRLLGGPPRQDPPAPPISTH